MKRIWLIMMTTESYHPNFKGIETEVKEFPIPEDVKNWMEVKKDTEQKVVAWKELPFVLWSVGKMNANTKLNGVLMPV